MGGQPVSDPGAGHQLRLRDADVVFAENATGGLFLEKADELRKYISIFDTIRATALTPEASIEMIELLVEEPLWKTKPRVSGSI